MSMTSDQLNYLIWRYLQESGFELSTYAFQSEAKAEKLEDKLGEITPIGSLVRLVQKGIQLTEIEAAARQIGRGRHEKDFYTLVSALELEEYDLKELERLEGPKVVTNGEKESNGDVVMKESSDEDKQKQIQKQTQTQTQRQEQQQQQQEEEDQSKNNAVHQVQVEITKPRTIRDLEVVYETIPSVFSQWCPSNTTLTIGTKESKVNVIQFQQQDFKEPSQLTLYHNPSPEIKECDVTAISWNNTGDICATASFDGQIKLWTSSGKLRHTLLLHRAPVLAIKWNKSGTMILSIDCTNMVVVWDAHSGEAKQNFQHDSSGYAGADADWIDAVTYAATGEQCAIMVYKLGERVPLLRFQGHTQSINSIQFDQQTQLLASSSDDGSIRIWHGRSTTSVATLTGHQGGVLVAKWVPPITETAALDSNIRGLLVSASMDGMVKVWNAEQAICLATLALHESPVFCCEPSPNGRYVASGGADGVLVIWDIKGLAKDPETSGPSSERAIARYQNKLDENENENTISTVSWDSSSTKVFVSFPNRSVVVDIPPELV